MSAQHQAVISPRPSLREHKIRPVASGSQACKQEKHKRRSQSVGWGEKLCTQALYCDLFSQLAIDGDLFTGLAVAVFTD